MKSISKNVKSFTEITNEFEFISIILKKKFHYYINLANKGNKIPSAENYLTFSKVSEISLVYRELSLEINRKYTYEIIASLESRLVFYIRYVLKKNSSVGKKFRKDVALKKINGGKHLMLNDILSGFKYFLLDKDNDLYRELDSLIAYRNWIAHGRGWELPNHLRNNNHELISDKYDFDYSASIIYKLINILPNYPTDLKY